MNDYKLVYMLVPCVIIREGSTCNPPVLPLLRMWLQQKFSFCGLSLERDGNRKEWRCILFDRKIELYTNI